MNVEILSDYNIFMFFPYSFNKISEISEKILFV